MTLNMTLKQSFATGRSAEHNQRGLCKCDDEIWYALHGIHLFKNQVTTSHIFLNAQANNIITTVENA